MHFITIVWILLQACEKWSFYYVFIWTEITFCWILNGKNYLVSVYVWLITGTFKVPYGNGTLLVNCKWGCGTLTTNQSHRIIHLFISDTWEKKQQLQNKNWIEMNICLLWILIYKKRITFPLIRFVLPLFFPPVCFWCPILLFFLSN